MTSKAYPRCNIKRSGKGDDLDRVIPHIGVGKIVGPLTSEKDTRKRG